ncbi:MAG: DNA alkylation repair protein [Clostridiaceae bacterium]|nr:DNA alkylation repair protein [Clostridiaceae bacterium]
MNEVEERIRERLFVWQDLSYREFQSRLMPTVEKARVIGVRTPAVRRLARELSGTADGEAFCALLPHRYYEEDNLHAFLLERITDYDRTVAALERFLPYVDNWATCDMMSPKAFLARPEGFYEQCVRWTQSARTYTARFGIGMLMRYYLEDGFRAETLELVASVKTEEYYVHMMVAWFFATALSKQYDAAIPYLEGHRLDTPTHRKAIRKAIESDRIDDRTKAYLRTLSGDQ